MISLTHINLMGRQIVHHHELARFQIWAAPVFQETEEDIPVGGRVNRHSGHPPGNALNPAGRNNRRQRVKQFAPPDRLKNFQHLGMNQTVIR
jgi:hypothetical protein